MIRLILFRGAKNYFLALGTQNMILFENFGETVCLDDL